ncbi:MAG: hypothetical protein AAGK14_04695 [Verrucomicrobiota bacterium]
MQRILPNFHAQLALLLGILFGVVTGVCWEHVTRHSDDAFIIILVVGTTVLVASLLVFLVFGWGRHLFFSYLIVLIASYFVCVWLWQPSHVRFFVSNPGATGSYQMMEFEHWMDGGWIEGPTVEGWPMYLTFPDIDGDGFQDIRVQDTVHAGGVIEFIYQPKALDGVYWKPGRLEGRLTAGYPPSSTFYNYP